MSVADDLHFRIFGFRPAKSGTAYERLAAVVLAGSGWESVRHDTKVRPKGRRAEHQLDVTATHPTGSVRRLLVECKDWDKKVGKKTLDALVGVRDQSGFDAAMAVTTEGFTAGAIDVAGDEDIAMIVLRDHRPSDGPFIKRIEIILNAFMPRRTSFKLLAAADSDLPSGVEAATHMDTTDRFFNLDGTPAETLDDILKANGAPLREGVFDCKADLGEGRLVQNEDGTRIRVTGLRWTETMEASKNTMVHEAKGEPCLMLEQLDEHGEPHNGRLVVDRHLYAWKIDEDGTVVPRGALT